MTVKLIKFVSGEEIIGDVINDNIDQIIIKNPLYLMYVKDLYGNQSIKVKSYCSFSNDDEVIIEKRQIITSFQVRESIKEYYSMMVDCINETRNEIDEVINETIENFKNPKENTTRKMK